MGDKGETSVNSCGPRHPEWETRGQVYKAPRVGNKGETSVSSCGPCTQSGRQGEDKCKLMRPKAPSVGDKCGRQGAGGDKCKLMRPKAPINSCGPRHPESETRGRQV